ncbi:Zn-dependent hydrolase [Neobacillus mesonae]|uniref:Zn-dependent hydrolase n=1 Tax=Neobacillus mesonae TaxID=1193713 RepID=UPI002E1D9B88|nr:Zn-dependent hydrolase [Neobacillus mesonae]
MEVNINRLMNDFASVTKHNRTPGQGFTRYSYSEEDKRAREYLFSEIKQLGLSVKVDAIGNIRAKYGDPSKPSIMIGSHIDTVENGGKFDGLAGSLAALEVIRVLQEEKLELTQPVELIIFAEEEGSNFGIPLLGSKVLTGKYSIDDLKAIKNDANQSVYQVAKSFNLNIDDIEKDQLQASEVAAMIELHIEQGGVLEAKQKTIGVVQAIAGMKTIKITLEGDSNHAGTTPMELRRDPMVGASHIIAYIQKAAKEGALPTTVATVGKIASQPNMPNVIPQKIEFYADVRDVDLTGVEMVLTEIEQKVEEVCQENSLKGEIELVGQSKSVKLASRIVDLIEAKAKEQELPYLKMNSGAVHDAVMLTDVADVGMIFIPSVGGKSHSPLEYTSEQDIKTGCDLLLHVVKELVTAKQVTKTTS